MATRPATSRSSHGTMALLALGIVVVVGIVVALSLPGPRERKYPQRIEVRFWHMWTAEWKDVVERIVDRFNESQDTYEVVPLSVPAGGADTKFLLAVTGGDPPDVMAQWKQVIPKWADNGLLMPLDELMTPDEWESFRQSVYPIALKIGTYKGRLYGVTIGLNVWACYYHGEHLREAGLDGERFPDTLEELVEWGGKLHRFDGEGNLVRLGFAPQMIGPTAGSFEGQWFAHYAAAFGGGFYDWETGEVTIDTPENLRALTFLADFVGELGFKNMVRFSSGLSRGAAVEWPFMRGAFSITIDGQFRVEQLSKYAPHLDYRTAPIPPPAGGRKHAGWANGNFMIIPTGARNVEGAWEFIKFWSGLVQPARAAEFYTWGGWLPLSPAIAETPIYRRYVQEHPQFQTFLDVLPSENIQSTPPVPYQVYLWDRIGRANEAAVRGTLTPAEAIAKLRREIARERDRRRELGHDR